MHSNWSLHCLVLDIVERCVNMSCMDMYGNVMVRFLCEFPPSGWKAISSVVEHMNASQNLPAFCQFQIFTEVLENSWYLENSQGSNDCRQGAASTSTLTTFESVNSEGPLATVTSKYHQTSPNSQRVQSRWFSRPFLGCYATTCLAIHCENVGFK